MINLSDLYELLSYAYNIYTGQRIGDKESALGFSAKDSELGHTRWKN